MNNVAIMPNRKIICTNHPTKIKYNKIHDAMISISVTCIMFNLGLYSTIIVLSKLVYTTIFSSEGGGGSSFKPVTSFPESSTLVDDTPIDAVTQAKNVEML
jgi:hypothetical protein